MRCWKAYGPGQESFRVVLLEAVLAPLVFLYLLDDHRRIRRMNEC